MYQHPRSAIRKLVADHGPALLDESSRLDALLADLCGTYLRERFLLVCSLRDRIPGELLSQSEAGTINVQWLSQRLQRRYCLSAEAAQWAIDCWSEGLNIAPSNQESSRNDTEIDDGTNISLSDFPQGVLGRLLTEYGPALLNDPLRVNSLLADFCNPHSAERFLLVHALREDIPLELLAQEQGDNDHEQQLSQHLQSRYGFHIEAVIWALRIWTLALKVARSSEDPIATEAAKAHADAVANARLKAEERAAADTTVTRKAEKRSEAEETVRLKKRERDAADATAGTLAQVRAAAEETARSAADEWVAAKALARSTAAEVEGIMLHVLNNRPMTSSEVADILDKEQEQAITWLRQLQESGKVEYVWLERSPHYPCYRGKVDANVLAATEDIGSEIGSELETAARARAKELISAQATVLEHSKEKAVADAKVLEKTEDWLASEAKALEKAKEQTVAEAAVRLREQEHAAAVTEARLKAEEQALAEKIASKRKEERTAAEAAAHQKRGEWLTAERKARIKVEERLAAEAAIQQKAKERAEAEAAGRQKEAELKESLLQNLDKGPLTSRELAKSLQAEQEYVIALLRQLVKEERIERIWLPRSRFSPCYTIRKRPGTPGHSADGSAPGQRQLTSHSRGWLGVLWLWLGTMALVVLPMLLVAGTEGLMEAETTVALVAIGAVMGITAGLVGLIGMLWLWCGRMLIRMIGMKDSLSPRASSWVGLFWLWAGAMGLVGITGTFEPAIGLAGLGVGLIGMFWLWLGRVLQSRFRSIVR